MAIVQVARSLLFLLSLFLYTQHTTTGTVTVGSSLSPRTNRTSWRSPSGLFTFGFYPQGDKYGVGIWLVGKPNNTVVWTANRDDPLVSSNATIEFTMDGKLVVRTGQGGQEASLVGSELLEPATSASMLDSGNLVLYGNNSHVIWESFDFPTDTILGGQNLSEQKELISSKSSLDHSSGRFRISMQTDGNLVAYSVNSTNSPQDAYWSSDTSGPSSLQLNLDSQGTLALWDDSGACEKILANHSSFSSKEGSTIYRATLDDDGIFRLYLHRFSKGDFSSTGGSIRWSALEHQCDVKGFCGYNSYCRGSSDGARCDCFPGFAFIDASKRFLGCRRSSNYEQHCGVEDANITSSITPLARVEFGGHPYLVLPLPIGECKRSCLEDCNCEVALHQDGSCSKMKLPIIYGKANGDDSSTVLVKKLIPVPLASQKPPVPTKPISVTEKKNTLVLIVGVSLGSIAIFCSMIAAFSFLLYRYRVHKYARLSTDSTLGPAREFTLQSFSFKELEEATGGFTEEIRKGSFGAVYKGIISDGSKRVAVKRLERAIEQGEKEFQAEMAAIGHTHHKNIVQLLGFCMESSRKLLVFEYMENGSLADLLFDVERRPPWSERVRIALEVARGILYLHEECDLQIIHCNITTQNILMDESRTAKISDFGLAKLLMPNQTGTKTEVRGTRGYVAPELQRNAMVSTKADIYSYGVVLLEIVCCRSNMVVDVSSADEVLLCSWVYNCYITGELPKLVKDERVDMKSVERMVQIGLLCVHDDSEIRPSIKDVILMLEGIMDVPRPPCPTPLSYTS
ncbi:G-type lectin S-receptor-like serine/threonine-protein kinase LECRK1 [Syzygium oleosum]|uniref:G-type lectin S-receptor-like serine/threonine-protein kinase LECRK1 n=1 Tax=Syzygium oleosum TaxID=219896 RepID=UPI0011D2AEF5|nr:G-type lectin S-receptor-like serine/threonine-protein kinase LECRK1 [Syzygium oleosum]